MENNIENKEEILNTNNNKNTIVSAILIIGLLIAGAILLKSSRKSNNQENRENVYSSIKIREVSQYEHIIGNPSAEIVIVEYSDTECPFCKNFHNTMHNLVQREDVAWVYRHYPIASLHPKAFHEAEATECAWEQGGNEAFWKYTDEVYSRTESNNKLDVSELPKIAEDLGLDVNTFNTCLSSGKFASKVQADIDDGEMIGIQGTPTSFILKEGIVVDVIQGAEPLNEVMKKIDNL